MPKTKISDYSSTASNNTDVNGINIAEGMAPSNVNNAMREIMAQLKDWQSGSVSQDMSVNGALTVSGNSVLSSNLTASGNVTISGALTCTGAAVLSSNLSVSGNANVTGNTNLAAITCSGAAVFSSTVAANGNVTVGSATTNSHILNGYLTATTSAKIYLDDSVTTASAPVLSWDGDTDTGFFSPAANTIAIATNGTERIRFDSTGNTSVTGNLTATGGVGYPTGAGGTVTQLTSKSTGVTLDKICGQITTSNASLGGSSEVSFTLTNNKIAATDVVIVNISSGATTNTYTITVDAVAAGSCRIMLRNVSGTSRAEALVLNFVVIKSVAA